MDIETAVGIDTFKFPMFNEKYQSADIMFGCALYSDALASADGIIALSRDHSSFLQQFYYQTQFNHPELQKFALYIPANGDNAILALTQDVDTLMQHLESM